MVELETRAGHIETTRQAIIDAALHLLLERRHDGFSVQEVANRAGLTHRTVYRYFPSRQELIAATARSLASGLSDHPYDEASTVMEWIGAVPRHLARTERDLELVRSVLAAVLASDHLPLFGEAIGGRDEHRWGLVRRGYPHLSEEDAWQTFALLRHVTSSASYLFLRLRFAMSPAEATAAIQAGARQLAEGAARRDRLGASAASRGR
jgi:AcrR family transcriptional regulator